MPNARAARICIRMCAPGFGANNLGCNHGDPTLALGLGNTANLTCVDLQRMHGSLGVDRRVVMMVRPEGFGAVLHLGFEPGPDALHAC